MLTVAQIKAAIPKLTVEERAEVARRLGNWEDNAKQPQGDTPPNVREKLAEAAKGKFYQGQPYKLR
ncbi:MAG TPA: hypothetical protein VGN23_10265 [Verrucomicrobiae bacterium]|jgi:hypothetical protein